ncbi:MAG: dienelactone hydrolase family protein [Myxococcales bacterium]|nr:dienelactone hydrolase family protein [Myxococcales bacterium]
MDQADRKISFTRPDGQQAPGYVFPAAAANAPAVVLIQEWWGVNEQIKGVARRLADAGYGVLIPDLYRGKLAATGDEANHLMTGLDFPDAVHQDLVGAVDHAQRYHGKVAVMGFCMGGALTIAAAAHIPTLAAAVCFYGVPPAAIADPTTIRVPLQCHFAEQDDWCTPAVVADLEAKLRAGDVPFELHRYDAQHAFLNESRPEVHDPAAAALAWQRTLEFLGRHLGSSAAH